MDAGLGFIRCHVLDSVKQELNRAKIDPVIVPGGCTKYIQAPDVSWNKPFKAKVTEKYDEWMANTPIPEKTGSCMRARLNSPRAFKMVDDMLGKNEKIRMYEG